MIISKFVCGTCGNEYVSLPMNLAYRKPLDYIETSEAQRAERVWIDDDLCVIDGERFFIRGVLPLPVREGDDVEEEFRWGVWSALIRQTTKPCCSTRKVRGKNPKLLHSTLR